MAVTESSTAWTKFSRHFFFPLHKARVYISDFLTVQTYTEVQKQTMSF